jgi:hypothetical protein
MTSHRVVTNGMVYEIEDGERLKPKGDDEIEQLKCGCAGSGCENITSEYPGAGFIVRNTGPHRVRVGMQVLSGAECGRWTHFKLHPGEAKRFLSGGYCCPYEAEHY